MKKELTHIFLGLPDHLKDSCFWVEREYRINDLSFQSGGSDIVVQYSDGTILGYDWVKYPSKYIYRVLLNKANELYSELEVSKCIGVLPTLIQKVFARKYNKFDRCDVPFLEVWNVSSSHLPWEKLEEFTSDIYISFLNYFKVNLPIIKTYLSVWYPFSYGEILMYWEELEKGDAHYSVFLSDTDTIYPPKFGLCFNEKIRWNSKLRSKWEYGFDNMFIGYVEGTGGANVEFDEKDYLDTIIPLNLSNELAIRNDCILNHWSSVIAPYEDFENENNFVEPNLIDISHISRQFDFLDLSSLQEIIKNEKLTFLTNKSIWEHTMSRMIDRDFCAEIFFELRNQSVDKSS